MVVGYSKCNAHETSWRSGLAKKKKDLQAGRRPSLNPNPDPNPSPNPNPNPGLTRTLARVRSYGGDLISQAEIRNKVEMCDHDVPVIALGGGSIDPAPPVATEVDGSLEPEP